MKIFRMLLSSDTKLLAFFIAVPACALLLTSGHAFAYPDTDYGHYPYANAVCATPDPINGQDLSGKSFAIALVALISPEVLAAAAAAAPYVLVAVVVIAAAVVVAHEMPAIRAHIQSRSQAKPVTKYAVPRAHPSQRCSSYRPAPPPYASVKSSSNPVRNEAVSATVLSLQSGINPGGMPIIGAGSTGTFKDPNYGPGWTKYSLPFPHDGFEVHYSLNEENCWYADVKATEPF